jgi:short-subunit dehydrogenase
MKRLSRGDRVLITGGTSGLGREAARQLAARGCRVAITGRRREKLDSAAQACRDAGAADVLTLEGSVSNSLDVQRHFDEIMSKWGGLDAAILNAGVGEGEHGAAFDARVYRWTFETNVFGACEWLERIVPVMVKQGRGVIAGVASPAGWRGIPRTGAYSSSKAALATLLESLRVDLRGSGVDIVIVCPGFVRSELTDRNDPKDMWFLLDTADGVRRMLRGIDRRTRVAHFPFPFTHALRYLVRPMPGWLFDRFAARFVRRNKRPYVDESAR